MRMRCKICGEWWNVSAREKTKADRYVCMVCKAEEDRAVAVQADLREEVEARARAYRVKRAIRHGGGS